MTLRGIKGTNKKAISSSDGVAKTVRSATIRPEKGPSTDFMKELKAQLKTEQ